MGNNTETPITRTIYILKIRKYGEEDEIFLNASEEEAEAIVKPYFIDCTFNEEVRAALEAAKTIDQVDEILMDKEIGYFDIYTQDVTFKD